MDLSKLYSEDRKFIQSTYDRYPLAISKGRGSKVYDFKNKEYLDFIGGIACISVGHANSHVTKAIADQAKKLMHTSNFYYTEPQIKLAKELTKLSSLKKAFFCNSGTEANEAAIKLAKLHTKKRTFIAFHNSFHGRTTASLALTHKEKYRKPFQPLSPKVKFAEYNNIDTLKKTINKDTAAIILEPIQGEAGVIVPSKGYLSHVQELCQKKDILLIVDEVQTGNGRTGKYFGYQHEIKKPDIVTTAKGLANGLPIGAMLSDLEFGSGDHASTFGGNPVTSAAALATIKEIKKAMPNTKKIYDQFSRHRGVRGKGAMLALETNNAKQKMLYAMQKGLLVNHTSDTTLRLLPPLNSSKKEVSDAISILKKIL